MFGRVMVGPLQGAVVALGGQTMYVVVPLQRIQVQSHRRCRRAGALRDSTWCRCSGCVLGNLALDLQTRLQNIGRPELRGNQGNVGRRLEQRGIRREDIRERRHLLVRRTAIVTEHLPKTAVTPARSRPRRCGSSGRSCWYRTARIRRALPSSIRGCQANPKRGARRRNWLGYCPVSGNAGFSAGCG